MEQRSTEWFAARKGRVTGSVVGGILGYNPWMTQADALRSMVREYHRAPREFTGNIATQWGVANEAGAVAEYEMETGNTVMMCGFYEYDDWLGASPDGLVSTDGLVEIKCPYSMRLPGKQFKSAKEQMHYYAQMQIQMFVSDRKWCHFYQWSPHGTRLELVEYDRDFLATVLPVLHQFWLEVRDACENDFERHIKEKHVKNNELEALQLMAEYDDAVREIKKLTERKAELLEKIVETVGRKDTEIAGRKLTFVKKAGAISYATAIKELVPNANLEKYRGKPSEYWVLGS
jgi:putative phage-type endonuclease